MPFEHLLSTPLSALSAERTAQLQGQEVTALVTKVDPAEQKISLSIRALDDKEQRAALKKLAVQQSTSQKSTLGDLLTQKLAEKADGGEEE